MRKYIAKNCSIVFLQDLDVSYYETLQDTMLIIIKNTPDPSSKYIFNRNNSYYITPKYKELQTLVSNTTTLSARGFEVKTGDVVWNQVKSNLTDNPTDTVLIYMTNIIGDGLYLNNIIDKKGEKKQYIKNFTRQPLKETAILVHRGYGNVAYKLHYTLVKNMTFYAENHVNMIITKDPKSPPNFEKLMESFKDPRTKQFIEYFSGNGAMSKTELEQVLPVFT
jgi:hypothetical protein